jgi:hypothetical protein
MPAPPPVGPDSQIVWTFAAVEFETVMLFDPWK